MGMTLMWIVGCVLLLGGFGCASSGGRASPPDADFTLVYLTTGPKSAGQSPEDSQKIFAGHMANMQRMANAGELVIAGPFDKPRDKAWRGIFVYDTPDLDVARRWAASDPGVIAGVFTPIIRPLRAPAAIRESLRLERELKAEGGAPPPGSPPKNIRAYVMLTTTDVNAAAGVIAGSSLAGKVLWCGRFTGDPGGVMVLDAPAVEEARSALGVNADTSTFGLDAWWSTISLTRLPPAASVLPSPE